MNNLYRFFIWTKIVFLSKIDKLGTFNLFYFKQYLKLCSSELLLSSLF